MDRARRYVAETMIDLGCWAVRAVIDGKGVAPNCRAAGTSLSRVR